MILMLYKNNMVFNKIHYIIFFFLCLFYENTWTFVFKVIIAITISLMYLWLKIEKNNKFEHHLLLLFLLISSWQVLETKNPLYFLMSLEVQSLVLCVLLTIKKKNISATESSIKYFFMSCLATALFFFGVSLIYAQTGSIDLIKSNQNHIGMLFVLMSFALKLSAAPFHIWIPDIYQGASTGMAMVISVIPKISILIAMTKLYPYFPKVYLTALSIISFIIGSIGGLLQSNIKRLMAYSSIHFLGFMFLGLSCGGQAFISSLYALVIYSLNMLLLFTILIYIKRKMTKLRVFEDLEGLYNTSLFISICLSIVIGSLAGIPLFPGFLGKFMILNHALAQGQYLASIIAIVSSIIAMIYYLRFIKHIFLYPVKNHFDNFKQFDVIKGIILCGIIAIYVLYIFPGILLNINNI